MSRFAQFRQAGTAETARLATAAQQNVANALRALAEDVPILNGVLVKGVKVATGETTFAHRLGRRPIGFFPTDALDNFCWCYRTAWNDKTITIYAANATTADFWVF